MKFREKEERQRKREKEKEEKERLKEKEIEERNRKEEKNKREREEKERQKQLEKENKLKLKEEREKKKLKEREEREKEKKREKEEREKQKLKLREERRLYNERFQNINRGRINQNRNPFSINSSKNRPIQPQGGYFQRQSYTSNKLFKRKRRFSHKRIQPKNRIPRLEPKKNLGRTALKIIKPRRYDEDESDSEAVDFEEKLMKFPRFRAKYGKNYTLKNKNKYLTSYLNESAGKNITKYSENRMGATRKTNLTISEVDEEEEKNYRYKNLKKGKLGQIKPKGKFNMDKKMREILGKQYKILLDDPLNPYSTCWPSNFLKAGYDTGFEYDNFQSGVPVLKLRSLGKKQLPPIKKKGMHFNENGNSVYSPKRNSKNQNLYPGTSAKKNNNNTGENFNFDYKVNKSDTFQFQLINNNKNNDKEEDFRKSNGITEANEE